MNLVEFSGFQALTREIHKDKTIVLMYHGVCPNTACYNDWLQVQEDDFFDQMQYLFENHDVISLGDAIFGEEIEKMHSGPNIVVTFDDGYANNYTQAYPILKKFEIPATIFLVTDHINTDKVFWYDKLYAAMKNASFGEKYIADKIGMFKRFHPHEIEVRVDNFLFELGIDMPEYAKKEWYSNLSIEQVREMNSSGLVDFGSHTHRHELLTNMDLNDVEFSLKTSMRLMDEMIPDNLPIICYPNGWYNEDIHKLAAKIGYIAGIRADHSSNGFWKYEGESHDIIPALPRWGVGRDMSMDNFKSIVSGSLETLRQVTHKTQ